MKRLLAIFVFTCLLAQCLLQLGVIGYYELNKQYIAQNLCENRDKPQMKCCGKCYLRKQLSRADKLNQPVPRQSDKSERPELVVFILPVPSPLNRPCLAGMAAGTRRPVDQDMHDVAALSAIFHPPGITC